MPNTILSAWGKPVNSVRIHSLKAVDEYPQLAMNALVSVIRTVHNHMFVPFFPNVYADAFPQVNRVNFPLLMGSLSTLSTEPITTTTNLKKEER